MARKIRVDIVGDSASLERSFARAKGSAAGLNTSLGRLTVGFGSIVRGVIAVDLVQKAIEGLSHTVHLGIEEFKEHATVTAQTEAALKSTGGVANVTAKQIDALGLSLSNLSGVDDEVVQSGANVLLAFQNIRNFSGKANDIFTQATKAAVDFSVRSGRSVPAAAVAIGRALQDPAKAAGSLRRAYVVLTSAEKAAIASAVAHGDTLKGQRLILADLEKRYGGAAKAAGETLPGKLNILHDRFKDLAGEIVAHFRPAFAGAVTSLTDFVRTLSETQGTHAKLQVVWTGIQAAAKGAQASLRRAISQVDWNAVWAGARGIADGLATRLQSVDWTKVGTAIGTGIARAISVAASASKSIAGKLEKIFGSIDWVRLGKAAGPGLAAALVTAFATLTDPTFWIKNWDLALAVAAVAFGGPIGKLGGKLVAPFRALGVRVGERLALGLAGAVERLGGAIAAEGGRFAGIAGRLIERFANVLLAGLLRIPSLIGRALAPVTGLVGRIFGRLGRLATFTIKVLGVQAVIDTVVHVFGRLAGVIGHALDNAWKALKKSAIEAALAIIDPFASIPTWIVGNKFQDIKKGLQTQLDGMVGSAQKAAGDIQAAFDGITPPAGPVGPATPANQPRAPAQPTISHRDRNFAPRDLPPPPAPTPPKRKGITADQRNTFFDNAISSDLGRVGFIDSIKGQIASLQRIAGLISARLAVTKDITRRRTLEDQLLSVQAQIKADQQQVGQDFLASLQFGVTKAQATASFKDDLAALDALKAGIQAQIKATGDSVELEQQLFDVTQQITAVHAQMNQNQIDLAQFRVTKAGTTPGFADDLKALTAVQVAIKAQIKATGKTLDLQQQLFDNQQQIAAARAAQRNAAQFKALGLTATGDTPTPGIKHLKAGLAKVTEDISGTFLDTDKTKGLLAGLRNVLAGGLGAVGQTVRAKVQEILDDLERRLHDHTQNLTKFSKVNSTALLKAAGLDPDQIRKVRASLSQLGAGGTVHGVGVGAFGVAVPSAGGPGFGPIVVQTSVNLDGKTVATSTTKHQQTGRRRNPPQRRGPHAGGD